MNYSPLTILDVIDPGIPNSERIPIRVGGACYLGNFWVGLAVRQEQERSFPINDNLLWLGNGVVAEGDWIFVYTGKGSPRVNAVPNQPNKIYTLHWNRDVVLFSSPELYPVLIEGSLSTPPSFSKPSATNALVNALLGLADTD